MCSSRANAFTIRIPETLSSASAVSSAIRCWTSCTAGPREPVEAGGGEDDERDRDQRQRRQPRLEREHDHAGEHDRERVLGQEDQPVAEEEADRLQVDRRPRHQLAGLLAVEEAELEPLQVRVDALAQVELDRERDLAGDQPPDDGQPEAQEAGADDRQGERQERVAVALVDRVDGGCRSAAGSAPSSPSPPRRRPATRSPCAGTGAENRAIAGKWAPSDYTK